MRKSLILFLKSFCYRTSSAICRLKAEHLFPKSTNPILDRFPFLPISDKLLLYFVRSDAEVFKSLADGNLESLAVFVEFQFHVGEWFAKRLLEVRILIPLLYQGVVECCDIVDEISMT